jgi:hypothetical protein
MERRKFIADLHAVRSLLSKAPPRLMPKFRTKWRDRKARKILIALLNDPTTTPEIESSIRRALSVESRSDQRGELEFAISKATGAYLMALGKVAGKRELYGAEG